MSEEIEDFELPGELPYTCAIETNAMCHAKTCVWCKKEGKIDYYFIRFPDDKSFLEWEARGKNGPNRAHVAAPGTNSGGGFCSIVCAMKAYYKIYLLARIKGKW
jgi:hypothetical protein